MAILAPVKAEIVLTVINVARIVWNIFIKFSLMAIRWLFLIKLLLAKFFEHFFQVFIFIQLVLLTVWDVIIVDLVGAVQRVLIIDEFINLVLLVIILHVILFALLLAIIILVA